MGIKYENLISSNFYYNLKTYEKDEYILKNPNEILKLPSFDFSALDLKFEYYTVTDDELIDAISYKLYETPRYWDIIAVLNELTSIDDLPKNMDIIIKKAQKKFEEFQTVLPFFNYKLTEEDLEEIYQKILDEEKEKNEKFRQLKYVTQSDLNDLIAYYKENLDKIKLDENLIINKDS